MKLTISIPDGVALVAGKKQLTAVMRAVGNEVAQTARASIRAGGATKKRKAKRQSTAGQPPVSRTGQLAKSIKVRTSFNGSRVTITDVASNKDAFYALFLEYGAKGGGGNSRNRANILLAGERNSRGRVLRGQNRMIAAAVNKARVLAPHPFLQPALDRVAKNGLADRVRQAVLDGVRLEARKPTPVWSIYK
jgi:HK97 gp10 family phage protein